MGLAVTSTQPLPSLLGSAGARGSCTSAVLPSALGWRERTSPLGTASQKSSSVSLPAQEIGRVENDDSALQLAAPGLPSVGSKGWHRSVAPMAAPKAWALSQPTPASVLSCWVENCSSSRCGACVRAVPLATSRSTSTSPSTNRRWAHSWVGAGDNLFVTQVTGRLAASARTNCWTKTAGVGH
jgi:hypothetical protein